MPKITEIKVTNNFVLIILDDKRKYKISEDDYFEYRFRANDDLSTKQMQSLERISNFHNAYMRALNKLKFKDRSEYEIRSTIYDDFKLIKPEVDKIIDKLKRYDFIDDIRYTKDLIERSQLKLYGYNRIKDLLIQVKINSNLIDSYLVYNEDNEFKLAYTFANKSLMSIRNHNYQTTLNKLRSRLLYRGFNNSVISRVLEEIDLKYDENQERLMLDKDFNKALRRYNRKYESYKLKDKMFNYLASQGYRFELINEFLKEMEINE